MRVSECYIQLPHQVVETLTDFEVVEMDLVILEIYTVFVRIGFKIVLQKPSALNYSSSSKPPSPGCSGSKSSFARLKAR